MANVGVAGPIQAAGSHPSNVDDNALFESVGKKVAEHFVKENKELVEGFGARFFRRTIEEGLVNGPNGQPLKLSPEQLESHLVEFKKQLLDDLLTQKAEELQEDSKESFAKAAQHSAESARLKESSQIKLAEAARLAAKAEKEGQEALTKQFWSIFNGKNPLPAEKIDAVFQTYLADRSLTVEETSEGKGFGRINSMSSVIKYLQANPLTKLCDFRTFKTEVNDVGTLADFLKTPAAFAIKGVAFKSGIAEIAKEKLAEAAADRATTKSPLKVQYFA